ncbi:hypothetical protein Ahy_A04g017087 isoform A [Arachis hypogaea]|uniref:Uncharacterized protein n=1 Tax=Arachis hypogaea TaxID=3818 RepID=A0A445D9X1_ARAHY|nr:hypothetical protein Ahy_A04g017087 isoform A [Arachis hypogaea]
MPPSGFRIRPNFVKIKCDNTKKTDMEGERNVIIWLDFSQLISFLDQTILLPARKSRNVIPRLEIRIIRVYNFTYTESFKRLHHQNTHAILFALADSPGQEQRGEYKIHGNHACDRACKDRKRDKDS